MNISVIIIEKVSLREQGAVICIVKRQTLGLCSR